jgi:hypothetical protein
MRALTEWNDARPVAGKKASAGDRSSKSAIAGARSRWANSPYASLRVHSGATARGSCAARTVTYQQSRAARRCSLAEIDASLRLSGPLRSSCSSKVADERLLSVAAGARRHSKSGAASSDSRTVAGRLRCACLLPRAIRIGATGAASAAIINRVGRCPSTSSRHHEGRVQREFSAKLGVGRRSRPLQCAAMTHRCLIAASVSPQAKANFRQLARRQHLSESALLKRLVWLAMRTAGSPDAQDLKPPRRRLRGARLSLRLHASDRSLLAQRAAAAQMPLATYVCRLVRNHLRDPPSAL